MTAVPGRVSHALAPDERLVGWRAEAAWLAAGVATVLGLIAAVLLPAPEDTPPIVLPEPVR